MTVAEANKIMERFGFGQNPIGDKIADGWGTRGRKQDRLIRKEFLPQRYFRVSCDWKDGKESHEVPCTLEYRFEGGPKKGRGYVWYKWEKKV